MKRLMYAIPLSAIAVLVFAAIAAAQDVPTSQEQGQEPSQTTTDANTTDVRNSTTTTPAETTTPTESTAPAPSSPTMVDISDRAFNPDQLNITPGTTVTFVNSGSEPHTATAYNDLFHTGVLQPGESFEVYFEGAGTVTYRDTLNPDMQGSIIVGEDVGEEDTAPQMREAAEAEEAAEEAAEEEADNESSSEADGQDTESDEPTED